MCKIGVSITASASLESPCDRVQDWSIHLSICKIGEYPSKGSRQESPSSARQDSLSTRVQDKRIRPRESQSKRERCEARLEFKNVNEVSGCVNGGNLGFRHPVCGPRVRIQPDSCFNRPYPPAPTYPSRGIQFTIPGGI